MLQDNEPDTQEDEHEDDQEEAGGWDDDTVTQEEWDEIFVDEIDTKFDGFQIN